MRSLGQDCRSISGRKEPVIEIARVTAHQLRIPRIVNVFDGTQDVLVVEVTTESGLTGLGEVVSSSYVAKAIIEAPRSGAGRQGLSEAVIGMDATNIDAACRQMYEETAWYGRRGAAIHAMAGVEMALWDIKGKAESVPAYRLLAAIEPPDGPAALHAPASPVPADSTLRPPIRAYASVLWGDTLEETVENARDLLDKGFGALKLGFGPFGLGSIVEDVETLTALRAALGDDVQIMVDVGRKWDSDRAIEECSALRDFGLGWIEEPLHPDDLEGYRRLCDSSPVPIAGAETEETVEQFVRYLDAGLGVIQPDLGRCGPGVGTELSRLARERGRRCVPHCFGTGINTTAAIHWMSAAGGDLVEYPMGDSPLRRDLAAGVPSLEGGFVKPSDKPGWGIEIDPGVLEEYGSNMLEARLEGAL